MLPVTCSFCGLPFKVRKVEPGKAYFCCTGCAMVSGIPVDAQGQFPVNRRLVALLATGFVAFNQLLFWLLAGLLEGERRGVMAERMRWLSIACGLAVLGGVLASLKIFRAGRGTDAVVVCAAMGLLFLALRTGNPDPVWMALCSGLLLAWSARGLLVRKRR